MYSKQRFLCRIAYLIIRLSKLSWNYKTTLIFVVQADELSHNEKKCWYLNSKIAGLEIWRLNLQVFADKNENLQLCIPTIYMLCVCSPQLCRSNFRSLHCFIVRPGSLYVGPILSYHPRLEPQNLNISPACPVAVTCASSLRWRGGIVPVAATGLCRPAMSEVTTVTSNMHAAQSRAKKAD